MREYTLEDWTVDKDRCRHHASGTWSVPIFGTEPEWNINYSDILTYLIQAAGRYCESYASDLFIYWRVIEKRLRDRNYEGEKIVFGFREMGVDTNDWVVKNYNECGCHYYRKIITLEIVVNGNHIDMYM